MAVDTSGDSSGKALALLTSILAGLIVGAAAVFLQRVYAPFGVFPLIVGMLTGGATLLPLLFVRSRGFGLVVSAALLASFGCAAAYHYGTFLMARRDLLVEADRIAAAHRAIELEAGKALNVGTSPAKPITLAEYYELQWQVGRSLGTEVKVRGWMLAAWWILDGLLIWLGAAIVAVSFTSNPGAPAAAGAAKPSNPEPPTNLS
jgi:hypothetical protein